MTRKLRSSAQTPTLREVAQPLEIFDTALDLLDSVESHDSRVPTVALPSLLERCEAVVGRVKAADVGHRLLICVDGLDVLMPDWWQRYAGSIGAQRLPAAPDAATLEAHLTSFERGERRQGCHALSLATLDEAPGVLRSFGTVRLLTWHPWASFAAAPLAVTLEAHCRALTRRLDQLEGLRTLKIEDLGGSPVDQARGIAAALDLTLPRRRQAATPGPVRVMPPARIEGGAAYEQLCARLGYATDSVPLPPAAARQPRRLPTLDDLDRHLATDAAEPGANPARVSWFLPRLTAMGLSPSRWPQDRLNSLIGELDAVFGAPDASAALESLVHRLAPDAAALTFLLSAAHYLRCEAKTDALASLARALEGPAGSVDWLRMSAATVLVDLGYPVEALITTSQPVLQDSTLSAQSRQDLLGVIEAAQNTALQVPGSDAGTAAPGIVGRLREKLDPAASDEALVAFEGETLPKHKIVIACHHKSGTNFLRRCFDSIALDAGLRIWFKFYDADPGYSQWEVCFHQHGRIDETLFSTPEFRGVHCVRHPMSLIHSATLYHEKCSEPWVDVPLQTFTSTSFQALSDRECYNRIKDPKTSVHERAALMRVDAAAVGQGADYVADFDFAGRTYRQILRSLPRIEDKLKFEMACFSHGVVMDMVRFPGDLRFRRITLEEISHDREMTGLAALFRHLGFEGRNMRACLQRAALHCLWNKTDMPPHATTGVSDAWRAYFRHDALASYRGLFGQPETALGFPAFGTR